MSGKRRTEADVRRVAEMLIEKVLSFREEAENRRISLLELVPIDPLGIATMIGLDVCKVGELAGAEGMLDVRTSSMFVRDSASEGPRRARQRFTIAHEVGHSVLSHEGEIHHRASLTPSENRPIPEQEADRFAAELLTPASIVPLVYDRYFGKHLDHQESTDDEAFFLSQGLGERLTKSGFRKMSVLDFAKLIACAKGFGGCQFDSLRDKFGVSTEAMAIRLLELKLVR